MANRSRVCRAWRASRAAAQYPDIGQAVPVQHDPDGETQHDLAPAMHLGWLRHSITACDTTCEPDPSQAGRRYGKLLQLRAPFTVLDTPPTLTPAKAPG